MTEKIHLPVSEALLASEKFGQRSDGFILMPLFSSKAHETAISDTEIQAFEKSEQRVKFLALNFAANQRGLVAPVFRKKRLPSVRNRAGKNQASLIEQIYSLDRQLIDIHWWFCRSKDDRVAIPGAGAADDIYSLADWINEIARQRKSAPKKTEALHIPTQRQLELSILRTKPIADRYSALKRSYDKDITSITSYCLASKQLTAQDTENIYDDLRALRLAQHRIGDATKLRALIQGKVPEGKDYESSKQTMRRRYKLFSEKLNLLKRTSTTT